MKRDLVVKMENWISCEKLLDTRRKPPSLEPETDFAADSRNQNSNNINPNLSHRTMSGMLWMGISAIIQITLQIAVLATLARLLTPTDFGVVSAAMVIVALAGVVTIGGIGQAIVQRPELTVDHIRSAFTLSVGLGVFLFLLIELFAPLIEKIYAIPELSLVTRALGFIFLLQGFGLVAENLISRKMAFKRLAIAEVASYCCGFGIIGITLASLGFGYWALVGAAISQALLKTIITISFSKHDCRPLFNGPCLKEISFYGTGFSLGSFSNYFANQGDNFIVGRYLGAEVLGLYSRAYQLMTVPANLYGRIAAKVFFPAMSKVCNEPKRFSQAHRRGIALTALAGLPLIALLITLAPELVNIILGDQWLGLIIPFQILSLSMYFRLGYKISENVLNAKGAVYKSVSLQTIYASMVILGSFASYKFGLKGVAIAVSSALAVHYTLSLFFAISISGLSLFDVIKAHRSAVIQMIIAGSISYIITLHLRPSWSDAAIVIITITTVSVAIIILSLISPNLMLGKEGIYIVTEFRRKFKR